ncbi:MAG: hypothetical protein LBK75_02160 [Oscillospiraceae bacterium]|jgi:hypothetical protein|nr:hypothetical protein [Oscillospiraceae bacterium]
MSNTNEILVSPRYAQDTSAPHDAQPDGSMGRSNRGGILAPLMLWYFALILSVAQLIVVPIVKIRSGIQSEGIVVEFLGDTEIIVVCVTVIIAAAFELFSAEKKNNASTVLGPFLIVLAVIGALLYCALSIPAIEHPELSRPQDNLVFDCCALGVAVVMGTLAFLIRKLNKET